MRRLLLVLVCAALVCAASGAAAVKALDRGIVMRVQPPSFVIRELDGTRMRFVIGPRTVITLDGRRVRLAQLRRGDVASVEHAGRRAIEVRALRP